MKKAYWALFDDTGTEPGEAAIAVVRGRAERFTATYAKRFPSAVDCLNADFASLTTYFRFPPGHHARIRHSSFIERTFGETPGGARWSAGSRANARTWVWCGRCWTEPAGAGGVS